jgi:UDP-N-acetylglucosamine transferase subunit ALG13
MSVLLVASVGGHLSELAALVDRLGAPRADRVWVTWRNPQSESLLAGEDVEWVPPVHPRDARGVLTVSARMRRLLSARAPERVVTTGSALALAVAPAAAWAGVPVHFIETATRAVGPSVTGRVLRRLPGVQLYTQHPSWATPPWRFGGSVFDGYAAVARTGEGRLRRAVVTLGTMEGFAFRRLLERLSAILPPGVEVLWQTGCTSAAGLGIDARPLVPNRELTEAMAAADVVIGHCGAGTALAALDAGRVPVLVPRQALHGEHVDDHQAELATELRSRGVAVTTTVAELDLDHLLTAAAVQARQVPGPPFDLVEPLIGRRARRLGRRVPATTVRAERDIDRVVLDLTGRVLDLTDRSAADRAGAAPGATGEDRAVEAIAEGA